jgi:hypothetical protein
MHTVKIDNRDGGTVEWRHNRWWWTRKNGGTEPFPRGTKLTDITRHIRRIALTANVRIAKGAK